MAKFTFEGSDKDCSAVLVFSERLPRIRERASEWQNAEGAIRDAGAGNITQEMAKRHIAAWDSYKDAVLSMVSEALFALVRVQNG